MGKRLTTIIFLLMLFFSFTSLSYGFGNDANKDGTTPDPNDQRPYTRENTSKPASEGGYKGGHDSITAEGMLLKEKVHQQTDPDGGVEFRNKMVREALPSLRTGAHD